jgi:predicted nucleic acid-binding protein
MARVKFGYLLDTSAFWHLARDPEAMKAWEHYDAEGMFHVSEPTRAEILKSQHRGPGPIDLLVAATAMHHSLTVLHIDNDFATIASVMSELRQQDIRG